MTEYLVGFALCAIGWGGIAYILWRYPDFRRAFFAHWRSEAVAQRLKAWAERNRR